MRALYALQVLRYLNLAINKIRNLEGLECCEFLEKLDLTLNAIDAMGLRTLGTLRNNSALRSLYLMGNPCCEWKGVRLYAISTLPDLAKLVGSRPRAWMP